MLHVQTIFKFHFNRNILIIFRNIDHILKTPQFIRFAYIYLNVYNKLTAKSWALSILSILSVFKFTLHISWLISLNMSLFSVSFIPFQRV